MTHRNASSARTPSTRVGALSTSVFAAALGLAACGPAGELDSAEEVDTTAQAATYQWIPGISEEPGKNWNTCRVTGDPNTLPSRVSCFSDYCDEVSLFCGTPADGVYPNLTASIVEMPYVSEENGGPASRCVPGTALIGLRATGSYSDNLSALCVPTTFNDAIWAPKGVLMNWSPWESEEGNTPEYIGIGPEVPLGVRCRGSFCDDVSFFARLKVENYPTHQFSEQSSRGTTVSGSWSPNDLIGECSHPYAYMTGISVLTELRPHRALCVSPSTRVEYIIGNYTNRLRKLSVAVGDQRADTGTGDWDVGYWKAECARNEVMVGISQTTDRRLSRVLCAPMNQNRSNVSRCTQITFSNLGDNRLNTLSENWDPGYSKHECGLGQVMKGVSRHPTTGEIHKMLCCDEQPDGM